MNSRVHPKYKTRYRVDNWPEYERSLVRRGDITLWLSPDALDSWKAVPSGRRAGQKRFSDTAIETALTLRLLFHLPLRQTEGFLRSLAQMLEKSKGKRTLVAVEGVYSMDGDLVKLPEVLELCHQYQAAIYIDEAHSTLMFGPNGKGVAEHFGLEDKMGVSFGTFSKSFGVVGGFVHGF